MRTAGTWYEHDRAEKPDAEKHYCTALPKRADYLWPAMQVYLEDRGLDYHLAVENGWYPSDQANDDFPRVVIPATSAIAGNVYWQARDLTGDANIRYQSPFASRGDAIVVVWPRGNPARVKRAAMVEGPADALAAAGAGLLGVALMGSAPPWKALALAAKLCYDRLVLVVLDRDAAGCVSVTRTVPYLVQCGLQVKVVDPYPHKDLAKVPKELRQELLQ